MSIEKKGISSLEEEITELTKVKPNQTTVFLWRLFGLIATILILIAWIVVWIVLSFILLLIMIIVFSLVNWAVYGNFSYHGEVNFIAPILFFIIIFCIWAWWYWMMRLYKKINPINTLREEVLLLHEKLKATLIVEEEIEWIVELTQNIHRGLKHIRILLMFRIFLSESGKEKIQKLGLIVSHITLVMLENLRSDLITRIGQQKWILQNAEREIAKVNNQTKDVFELQKSRLDRQIEQFEELQNILLKW